MYDRLLVQQEGWVQVMDSSGFREHHIFDAAGT